MTSDALPRFHRFAENVVSFCGYNGRGIGTGTVFGRVLADHVLGKASERTCRSPSPSRNAGAACGQGSLLRGRIRSPMRRRMDLGVFTHRELEMWARSRCSAPTNSPDARRLS